MKDKEFIEKSNRMKELEAELVKAKTNGMEKYAMIIDNAIAMERAKNALDNYKVNVYGKIRKGEEE